MCIKRGGTNIRTIKLCIAIESSTPLLVTVKTYANAATDLTHILSIANFGKIVEALETTVPHAVCVWRKYGNPRCNSR